VRGPVGHHEDAAFVSERHPPAWVCKRDGRLVPFDADKISRALFAASEGVGAPDAFTARELTDAVLHFISVDSDSAIVSSNDIRDTVVKVVRELGHPALAQEFAEHHPQPVPSAPASTLSKPFLEEAVQWVDSRGSALDVAWRASAACLRSYSLEKVFARDLVAAQAQGLLTLGTLESPLQLGGWTMPLPQGALDAVLEEIEKAREIAGQFLALDGPEYALESSSADPGQEKRFARELALGLRATGLAGVVNLHLSAPPSWAGELAGGPLFGGRLAASRPEDLAERAEAFLSALLEEKSGRIRVDWHVAAGDFAEGDARDRLWRLAGKAAEAAPLAFVFDRPRRAVALAEGLDRDHQALLLPVALHLGRLLQLPGAASDPEAFLQKLGSLARLALSAAVQKRDYLRKQERGWPPFLLQRARLVVVPNRLDVPVQHFSGQPLAAGGPALEFAKQLVHRLRGVLEHDGELCRVETVVDSAPPAWPAAFAGERGEFTPGRDGDPPPRSRIKSEATVHAVAEAGTLTVPLDGAAAADPGEIVDLIQHASQQTSAVRLRFVRRDAPSP
jgi:hypothetical protein